LVVGGRCLSAMPLALAPGAADAVAWQVVDAPQMNMVGEAGSSSLAC
jgi:hypothetical protein